MPRCSSSRFAGCWPTRALKRWSNNFAGQWLYLRNLAAIVPDARMFPVFDDNLRQAFRQETELFFESVIKENRSVLDLLRADYTFLDERLAKHYGMPDVYGTQFRRVTLPAGQRARRPAWPGQHSARHLVRQPHVAGAARQMGAREHSRHAAAAASCPACRRCRKPEARIPCRRCASGWRSTVRMRRARPATC